MQYSAVQCSAVQCRAVQCSSAPKRVVLWSAVKSFSAQWSVNRKGGPWRAQIPDQITDKRWIWHNTVYTLWSLLYTVSSTSLYCMIKKNLQYSTVLSLLDTISITALYCMITTLNCMITVLYCMTALYCYYYCIVRSLQYIVWYLHYTFSITKLYTMITAIKCRQIDLVISVFTNKQLLGRLMS